MANDVILLYLLLYINIERRGKGEDDVVVLALVVVYYESMITVYYIHTTLHNKNNNDDAQTDVPTFRIKYGSVVSITIAYVSVLLARILCV